MFTFLYEIKDVIVFLVIYVLGGDHANFKQRKKKHCFEAVAYKFLSLL